MTAATWSGGAEIMIDWVDVSAIGEDYRPLSGSGRRSGPPVDGDVGPGRGGRRVRAEKRDHVGDLIRRYPSRLVGLRRLGPGAGGIDDAWQNRVGPHPVVAVLHRDGVHE